MGGKVARHATLALAFVLALASMRCTVRLVNTQTACLRSDTTGLTTNLDVRFEPTPERPVAGFRAYSTAHVRDTRLRTNWLRYRPVPIAWVSAIGVFVAGCVADWQLAGSGRVVLGRDMAFGSAIPLIGIALGSLPTFRRTAVLIDTSRFTTPLPIVVTCGGNQVATLSPDGCGAVDMELKDYLSSLPVLATDTLLSICIAGSGGPNRSFPLTEGTYESAVAAHRADMEKQKLEERRRRLAEERARKEERVQAVAAEIDTICMVYEGLYSGACLSHILLALGGAVTTSDRMECLRIADAHVSQYKHAQSILTKMHSPSHFDKTYGTLNSLAADLPRYAQACYELITTGDLYTVTSAEYRRLHARFWANEPDGFPVVTQFQVPFKQELLKVGLSQELVNDLVICDGWTVHNPLQSEPGTARDYYYPRILKELEARQEKSGE